IGPPIGTYRDWSRPRALSRMVRTTSVGAASFHRARCHNLPDRCGRSVALDAQCSDPRSARSDRHVDGSRVCLYARGLLPPRRPIYWPKNLGAPLELDTRNERNQLGPLCKPVASNWDHKIGVEGGSSQSRKLTYSWVNASVTFKTPEAPAVKREAAEDWGR